MHAVAGLLQSLPFASLALLLADTLLKGTLLLGAAAIATRLMHRRSAASRHLVWTLTTVGLLSLPVLSLMLPALRVELLPKPPLSLETVTVWEPEVEFVQSRPARREQQEESAQTPQPRQWADAATPESASRVADLASAASTTEDSPSPLIEAPAADAAPAQRQSAIPWWQLLVAIWGVGVTYFLVRLAAGLLIVRRMTRGATPIRDVSWRAIVRQSAAQLGVAREVPVRAVDRLTTPMVCGVVSPTIIVPAEALSWSNERRSVVALHELAHVRRNDAAIEVLFQVGFALFWMHPLMWLAARHMRLERERACDDCVLAARTKPSAYADHLLDIVRTLGAGSNPSVAALAMARRSQFEGRLLAILDSRQKRGSVPRRARALSASAAAIVILPLSALNPWLNPVDAVSPWLDAPDMSAPVATPNEPAPEPPPASPAPEAPAGPTAPTAPAAPMETLSAVSEPAEDTASAFFQCAEQKVRGSWIHTNFEEHDDQTKKMRVVMAEKGRCLEVTSEGRVTFADDESDVVAISSGGHFSVTEQIAGTTRKLVIRPGNNRLDRTYTVNGTARDFDAEGRAWFSRMILDVIRETGYDADARVRRLLAKGGTREVLAEVDRITSSGGKARYLDVLLEVKEMTPDTLRIIAGMVAEDISSSGDKARLLAAIVEQSESDESVRQSVSKAAGSISSSGDKRRVLSALVEQSKTTESLILAARAARTIESSGDKTAVLLEIAEKYEENDELRSEYLDVAATIPSSGDRTRALMALLDEETLRSAALVDLLKATGGIASSGDKTRVLTTVAEGYSLGEDDARTAFYEALRSVSSSGDLRRVLATVLGREDLTDAELLAVIEATDKIGSSSDKTAVLLQLASSHGLKSAAVRDAFMSAAESLPSDGDYRRLMSTVTREGNLQF